jgi:hypothetical protein
MTIPELFAAIALGACALLILVGAWITHSKVKSSASRTLFWSVAVMFAWLLASNFVLVTIAREIDFTNPSKPLVGLLWAIGMVIPSALALLSSACFVLVARSLRAA